VGIEWLIGKSRVRVHQRYPENFSFEFGTGVLKVDCLWRIIAADRLVRTSLDHGHQYGLPAPVDAYAEAESMLIGRQVTAVHWREATADLTVDFEGNRQLEVLSNSSGYEPWNFVAPGIHLVALGGGGIADFSTGSEL
jgi:hypothetical protein